MADPAVKVIPTPYQQVLALLRSYALRAVEQPIATAVGSRVVEDHLTACASLTQADLSVSGLTVAEAEALLVAERDRLVAFGVAFLRDEAATAGGETPEAGQVHGLGVGFGVTYAIYYNFLARRTPAEFGAYLQNRRVPHRARFARELRRVFAAVQ